MLFMLPYFETGLLVTCMATYELIVMLFWLCSSRSVVPQDQNFVPFKTSVGPIHLSVLCIYDKTAINILTLLYACMYNIHILL